MPAYRLRIDKPAERQVRRLPGHVRQRFRRLINSLAAEPRPQGAKRLRGYDHAYRIRIDIWRLVYLVDDVERTVIVLGVRRKTGPETYEDISE